MSDINRVIYSGRIVRVSELRRTPGGTAVCDLVCVSKRLDAAAPNERGWRPTYIDTVTWGKLAESCAEVAIGTHVLVEGRLDLNEWVDKSSGQTRTRLRVRAEVVRFLDRGTECGARASNPNGGLPTACPALLPPGSEAPPCS